MLTIQISKEQLTFILDSIKFSQSQNFQTDLTDHMDENMGEMLVDMMSDTLTDPLAEETIHDYYTI